MIQGILEDLGTPKMPSNRILEGPRASIRGCRGPTLEGALLATHDTIDLESVWPIIMG